MVHQSVNLVEYTLKESIFLFKDLQLPITLTFPTGGSIAGPKLG